jgi:hypothetical protein
MRDLDDAFVVSSSMLDIIKLIRAGYSRDRILSSYPNATPKVKALKAIGVFDTPEATLFLSNRHPHSNRMRFDVEVPFRVTEENLSRAMQAIFLEGRYLSFGTLCEAVKPDALLAFFKASPYCPILGGAVPLDPYVSRSNPNALCIGRLEPLQPFSDINTFIASHRAVHARGQGTSADIKMLDYYKKRLILERGLITFDDPKQNWWYQKRGVILDKHTPQNT